MTENLILVARYLGIDPRTLPDGEEPLGSKLTVDGRREYEAEEAALTDAEYEMLEPHLPPDPRIEGMLKNKEVLSALIWAQATGRALTHMPSRYGSSEAVRKRAERWAVAGVWDRLSDAIPRLELPQRIRLAMVALSSKYRMRGDRIRNRRLAS
jgi:transposase